MNKNNVTEIKRLYQERKEAMRALSRFLISKGVAPSITEEILHELAHDRKELGNIIEIVSKKLKITGELSFENTHKIALIGPTGVGKTTTILKLAEHYLRKNKKVTLKTLDLSKKSFLQKWAEEKSIPFGDTLQGSGVLLIDTEGCNFYQPNRVDALGEALAEVGENIEVVLTLSAAAKEVDLYGAVHQFSSLCPSSLIFTKLDETLAPGALINVSMKTDLPIRYIAFGFPLPGEVHVADPYKITHKILTDLNQEEFHLLRQIALTQVSPN